MMPQLGVLLKCRAERGGGSAAWTGGSEASGGTCRLHSHDGSARSASQQADGKTPPRWRGAAPRRLTPNAPPGVSSPVPAHHLRALRVRAIVAAHRPRVYERFLWSRWL